MELDKFVEQFPVFASAPGGAQHLRNLILKLAVIGKLTTPNLITANNAENSVNDSIKELVNKKIIKKPKNLPIFKMSTSAPSNWIETTLNGLGYWAIGTGFPKHIQGQKKESILFIKVSDMNRLGNEKYITNSANTIDESTAKKIKAKIHTPGTIVFPKIGGAIATNKRRILKRPTVIDNNCLGITPYDFISQDWLYLILLSIDMSKYQVGTSVPAINQATLETIIVNLPPEEEQKRIVAKVDELMALCDKLEAQQQQQANNVLRSSTSAINALLNPSDPTTSFEQNWQRIAQHFNTLYGCTLPMPEGEGRKKRYLVGLENVNKLKELILCLASSGDLVEFDTLEKLKVSDLVDFGPRNGFSPKEVNYETSTKVLKLGATTTGTFKPEESKYVDIEVEESSYLWLKQDDILIQRGNTGIYVGSNVILEKDYSGFIYPDLMMKLRCNKLVIPKYLSICLSAPQARNHMWDSMTGTSGTMPKISKKVVESVEVHVPSIPSQRTLIQKIDHLMTLCDQLEQQLTQSYTAAETLMEATTQALVA